MLKRLLIALLVVVGLGALSPEARGLIVQSWNYVEQKVASTLEKRGKKNGAGKESEAAVANLDHELRRAEAMLANFRKVDDRLICGQSEPTVSIRNMERDQSRAEERLLAEQQLIRARNELLKNESATLIIDGQSYPRHIVARELESRFDAFRQSEAALKHQKELLAEMRVRLNVLVEQRQALKAQEAELQARIVRLKTSVERLKAAETKSRDYLGDTQTPEVAKLKELLDQIEKRVDVNLTELEIRARERMAPAIVLPRARTNLTADIDAHFAATSGGAAVVRPADE